jgi:hypothetical protein
VTSSVYIDVVGVSDDAGQTAGIVIGVLVAAVVAGVVVAGLVAAFAAYGVWRRRKAKRGGALKSQGRILNNLKRKESWRASTQVVVAPPAAFAFGSLGARDGDDDPPPPPPPPDDDDDGVELPPRAAARATSAPRAAAGAGGLPATPSAYNRPSARAREP